MNISKMNVLFIFVRIFQITILHIISDHIGEADKTSGNLLFGLVKSIIIYSINLKYYKIRQQSYYRLS